MPNIYEAPECVVCGDEAVHIVPELCDACFEDSRLDDEDSDLDVLVETIDRDDDAMIDAILQRRNYMESMDSFAEVDFSGMGY